MHSGHAAASSYDWPASVANSSQPRGPALARTAVPPFVIVIAMGLVFTLEIAAGLLCLYGAWHLFALRRADAAAFEAGKRWAKIGLGCAVLNWWGLFQGIAIAGYQLWQMPLGEGPMMGSWIYGGIAMMVLIYIGQRGD